MMMRRVASSSSPLLLPLRGLSRSSSPLSPSYARLIPTTCATSRYYSTPTPTPLPVIPTTPNIVKEHDYVNTPTFALVGTPMPCYRVMDQNGNILKGAKDPELGKDASLKMYRTMVLINVMDSIMYDIQRQGRVSFYMTSFGEEATHIGSAAGVNLEDIVYGQYREVGVLMWRGFSLDGQKNCVIVYFGEGAASEGDFHAAVNFSATLEAPVIFFCRNNKWAISTPSHEQYRGDGLAARGLAYGLHTIRVDGNDIWAVYNATVEARKIATEKNAPVMIEAMTYRVGHHSTSDDSSRYRTLDEVSHWKEKNNPITRLGLYLVNHGWWTEAQDKALVLECRQQVRDALAKAERQLKPGIVHLFTDVYGIFNSESVRARKEKEREKWR